MPEPVINTYAGRFAPTPSGPLHPGSIVAALASYLDAKHNQGRWLLRIDDIDTPRVKAGAAEGIIKTLEALGLQWDGRIIYQSDRLEVYEENIATLGRAGLLYRCYCPRGLTKGIPYPGTCREKNNNPTQPFSLRIKTDEHAMRLDDIIQGAHSGEIPVLSGDFIVQRADSLIAYHLATVLDDAEQGITHVVRGADLLDATFNQIFLQNALGLITPSYAHYPLIIDKTGKKLSKQDGKTDVLSGSSPETVLMQSLRYLGQRPERGLGNSSKADILTWAITNWKISAVPKAKSIPLARFYQHAHSR